MFICVCKVECSEKWPKQLTTINGFNSNWSYQLMLIYPLLWHQMDGAYFFSRTKKWKQKIEMFSSCLANRPRYQHASEIFRLKTRATNKWKRKMSLSSTFFMFVYKHFYNFPLFVCVHPFVFIHIEHLQRRQRQRERQWQWQWRKSEHYRICVLIRTIMSCRVVTNSVCFVHRLSRFFKRY